MGTISDAQGQLTPQSLAESGRNSNSSEIVICKYEEDPIKNEGSRVLTRFFPIIGLWEFFQTLERAANSTVHGKNWLVFEIVEDI